MTRLGDSSLARPVSGLPRTAGQTRSVRRIVHSEIVQTVVVRAGSMSVRWMTYPAVSQTVAVREWLLVTHAQTSNAFC